MTVTKTEFATMIQSIRQGDYEGVEQVAEETKRFLSSEGRPWGVLAASMAMHDATITHDMLYGALVWLQAKGQVRLEYGRGYRLNAGVDVPTFSFRVRVEFDVEVDNPSHIDAAWAAAEWLQAAASNDRFSHFVYDTQRFDALGSPITDEWVATDLDALHPEEEPADGEG